MTNRKGDLVSIEDRIAAVQSKYAALQTERNEHVSKANEMLTDLTKLEGQFEALNELLAEKNSKANKKATTVEAVPEEK